MTVEELFGINVIVVLFHMQRILQLAFIDPYKIVIYLADLPNKYTTHFLIHAIDLG